MDLRELYPRHGQSLWLDYIRRHLLTSGELSRLVQEEGLRGVTSNPSIFQYAIAGSTDYEEAIRRFVGERDTTAVAIYEQLAVEDIQRAADILRPVYEQSERSDGFVSMEVSPYLARDTSATLDEARRLWKTVARENLMVKVPATAEGLVAIRQLISEGINVNVTLLFSRAACSEALAAYMAGLELRAAQGGDLTRVASVASLFVSRLDVMIDPLLEAPRADGAPEVAARGALVGKVAIAHAKLVYRDWKETCRGARWRTLARQGARVQRMLWASTATKDPRMSDVAYVEAMIGPDTVDTIPPATLDAFRNHGRAENRLEQDLDDAAQLMAAVAALGISIDALTDRLLDEGLKSFASAFDAIMATIEQKRAGQLKSALDQTRLILPPALEDAVHKTLDDWRTNGKVRRLWARDASLWSGKDEAKWLAWLDVGHRADPSLLEFVEHMRGQFQHAVVLGMGGSSLCAEVLARAFGTTPGYPELLVLDSTDPAQVGAIEARIALDETLFIVSSKSGTTLEPNIFKDYFFDRLQERVGAAEAGRHFIAVTDPGSALEATARAQQFARVFRGVPGIGGRYSALSNFGLVPAAVMGVNVPQFLDRTQRMVHACASCVPPEQNPGVQLGVVLGTLALRGRDKLTLIISPAIEGLGAWLEQLIAESLGKSGKGIIPVDREPCGTPAVYGLDRVFVYVRLLGAVDLAQEATVAGLEQTGQPVVRIELADRYDLGQEFFRWEIAAAVAGAIIGVHPFDQPDVEGSKIATRTLTEAYESSGALPLETPFLTEGALRLYADDSNRALLSEAVGRNGTLLAYLKAHLDRARAGDYFAFLAYIPRFETYALRLRAIRGAIRDRKHLATCVGFGPRFLHSTGQLYKGGPDSGLFLQLTCGDATDRTVPGKRYSFGIVKAAQARADFDVLNERKRRALRIDLGPDIQAGLDALSSAFQMLLT